MSDSSASESQGRLSIIGAVRTPLSFFTLVVLIGEAGLLAFAAKAEGYNRTIGIVGMILLLLASAAAVYYLRFRGDAGNARFRRQITGCWWERISHKGENALSFFTITADSLTGNVILEGTSFDKDGAPWAKWHSEMTRLYPSDRRIGYLWRGKHLLPGRAHHDFHGYGTMQFGPPEDKSPLVTHGNGDFWDVDESQPGKTGFKSMELRRVLDDDHRKIMSSGSSSEKRDVVEKVIEAW